MIKVANNRTQRPGGGQESKTHNLHQESTETSKVTLAINQMILNGLLKQ